MNNRRIIYFVPDDSAGSGVIASQVIEQARYLNSIGARCLVIGADTNIDQANLLEKKIQADYSVECRIFKRILNGIPFVTNYLFALKLIRENRELLESFSPTHIYTRSCIASCAVITYRRRLRNLVHVHDMRGLAYEEAKLRRRKNDMFCKSLFTLEKYACKNADRLTCVSHGLGRWIEKECRRNSYEIIPCCSSNTSLLTSENRKSLRIEFGFKETDRIICYNGGLSVWQKIEDIASLFASLARIDGNFRFMILTPHLEPMKLVIDHAGVPEERCKIISCDNREVYRLMPLADAGIILRDDTLLNNVASPIKVGEYIACGLPVILSKGIGDFSTLLPQRGIGHILEKTILGAESIRAFLSSHDIKNVQNRCFEFHRSYLHWSAHKDKFERLYL